jgi:FkbM family methyltransferase
MTSDSGTKVSRRKRSSLHQWALDARARLLALLRARSTVSFNAREKLLHGTFRDLEDAKFIQVGSNDGVAGDPLREHILNNNWQGVLIEPVHHICEKLKALYQNNPNITVLNCAIGPKGAPLTFYSVDPRAQDLLGEDLPWWWDQLSSFNRNNIVKHLDGILEPYIMEIDVVVKTLDDILMEKGWSSLDVLHIDAEGFDDEVLKTLSMEKYQPRVILMEHKHLSRSKTKEIRRKLTSQGYDVHMLEGDLFGLRRPR